MAGRHVNDDQARQYIKHRKNGHVVETAAAKATSAGRQGTGWRRTLGCRRRSGSGGRAVGATALVERGYRVPLRPSHRPRAEAPSRDPTTP